MELSNEMQSFLISTVFGYDLNESDPDKTLLKKACIGRAYLDLSRVIPYRFPNSYLKDHKNDEEVKTFKDKKNACKQRVEEILIKIKNKDEPRTIIQNVKRIMNNEEIIKDGESFTFGMAQKWVNMYLKYLWLFGEVIIPEDKLDMPIDSYIIDSLLKNKDIKEEISKKEKLMKLLEIKLGRIETAKRPSECLKAWSKWEEEEYYEIQALIKNKKPDDKSILEWENKMWMEQAKYLRDYNL